MADFDAQQPVRTIATEFTTEVANSSGTTINPVEEFPQASTTSGQSGPLIQGATTTAAPTYTTGTTDPLSLTVAGALRVDGSSVTQPISGTVAVSSVSGNVTVVQPTGSNLNVAVSNFPADSDALGQGSTTAGQLGALIMGAVTTANPSYTTGQTDPLSLDLNGNLRVTVANLPSSGTPTYDYATSAAVASAGTATHSVAGPINIDKIEAAASGEMKITIAWGTTGSEVTYMTAFTTASDKTFEYQFPYAVALTSGQSIKITLKNQDTSAMDVYSTVAWH